MVRYVSEEPVMRNAEEFSGQRSVLARVRPTYRRPGRGMSGRPGADRIRYAHHGGPARDEPFGPVPLGPDDHRESDAGAAGAGELASPGSATDGGGGSLAGGGDGTGDWSAMNLGSGDGTGDWNAASLGSGNVMSGAGLGGNLGNGPGEGNRAGGRNLVDLGGGDGGDLGGGLWVTEFPHGKRHTDLWVLVCGGIAAAAAFAAAFCASGGVASHPASPETAVPAVVSQACPSPAAAPTP
jgi:hypothetical protein